VNAADLKLAPQLKHVKIGAKSVKVSLGCSVVSPAGSMQSGPCSTIIQYESESCSQRADFATTLRLHVQGFD
jgi:hypothetical protein